MSIYCKKKKERGNEDKNESTGITVTCDVSKRKESSETVEAQLLKNEKEHAPEAKGTEDFLSGLSQECHRLQRPNQIRTPQLLGVSKPLCQSYFRGAVATEAKYQ